MKVNQYSSSLSPLTKTATVLFRKKSEGQNKSHACFQPLVFAVKIPMRRHIFLLTQQKQACTFAHLHTPALTLNGSGQRRENSPRIRTHACIHFLVEFFCGSIHLCRAGVGFCSFLSLIVVQRAWCLRSAPAGLC